MSRIAPGTLIVVIFAILFGLVGAYAVQRQMAEKPTPPVEPAPEPGPQIHRLPLVATELEPGRKVAMGDVIIVSGTMEQLKKRYDLPAMFMQDAGQIIGRTLKVALTKNSTFAPGDFYPEGSGPSVAERLKPGLRAVTIHAEGAAAINGFASPESMVDVLFRTEESEDYPETTVTLVEGVEVLALNRTLTAGAHGKNVATVTLAVSATQANALKIAENKGAFSLALRNPNDDSLATTSTEPQTLDELLNLPKRQEPFKAEIYRGSSKTAIQFARPSRDRTARAVAPIAKAAKDAANGEAGKVGAAKVKQGNEVGAKSAIEKPAGDPVAVGGP